MELNYDWRSFQSMFYPKRRALSAPGQDSSPVYVVVEGDGVISAYGEGDDFSSWIGRPFQEMAGNVTHRELIFFNREEVDQWGSEALALPHFYDQVEFLRAKATPQVLTRSRFKRGTKALTVKQGVALPVHRHFLLEALQGWWAKVLPSSFGLFIRLQGDLEGGPEADVEGSLQGNLQANQAKKTQDLFMIIRRGRVDLFSEPEFSSVGRERSRQPEELVRYLSEKHLVPVQGIFVPAAQWGAWSDAEDPWKQVAMAIRSNDAKLVPFRWGVVTLVATRGLLGL